MLATLDAIVRAGFAVAVACPPQGPLAEVLRRRGVEVLPFSTRTAAAAPRSQEEARRELARLLDQQKPDLLHANSLSMGRLSGPVASALRLASIAHLRDILRLSRQAVEDLNHHRRLLAVSNATRSFHVAQGLDKARTHVLYNGVDLERFRPSGGGSDLAREVGAGNSWRFAVTIGQIGPRKGQDILVKAAEYVARRLPDVHWLVIGERFSTKAESVVFEEQLCRAAAGSLAGRMHLPGWRDDVARLLRAADVVVHPARQEPLGRVLLEAAASGAAIVATDVGGTSEIFPGGQAAVLVPPNDPESLARAVVSVLANDHLRRELGRAARRRAEEAFDIRATASRLLEHYRAALGT